MGDLTRPTYPARAWRLAFRPQVITGEIKPDTQTGALTGGEYINSVPYNVTCQSSNPAGTLALTFLNLGNGNLVNLGALTAWGHPNRGKVILLVVLAKSWVGFDFSGQNSGLRVSGWSA